ncbi:MAG: ABC transporter ATP-binding protein [Actinomycetota bacterium]
MGWGGGGFIGGGPPLGGGPPGKPQAGLPFAGIPHELLAGVERLVADEPTHPEPQYAFNARPSEEEGRRLSLPALLKEHPALLIWSAFTVLAIAVLGQAGPKLTELAINHGMMPGHESFTVVLLAAAAYLVLVVLGGLAQKASVSVTGRLAASVMGALRVRTFAHLQRLSLDFYTEEKAGVVMSRMTSDIENLQQLLQDGIAQFAIQGLTMVVIIIIMFTMNVALSALVILSVLPPLILVSWWFHKASDQGYEAVRDGIANVIADLSESLQGMRVVLAHNRQRHNVIKHRNVVELYRRANAKTGRVNAFYGPGTQLIGVAGQAVLIGVGGVMVLHDRLSIGALVAFSLYVNRFFQPIQLLVQQYNALQQGRSSINKLRKLLETQPSVLDAEDAIELGVIEGSIELEQVGFGYDPAKPVLQAVSISIKAGESVAFVGPTGAGKSTLAKLVARFYDPTEGSIKVDGIDLRKVTQRSLRAQLGVVPQEAYLFAGTLRDNLTFAKPDASEDELNEAIDAIGLRPMISRLPDGVDSVIHERGQSLSAGERQLLALGRAFLAQPRVLVLDEATSNLDLASEILVEGALDHLLEGRTAILIAHRLSTAQRADRIVVLEQGMVVEQGSHDELLELGGHYAKMFQLWADSGGRVS